MSDQELALANAVVSLGVPWPTITCHTYGEEPWQEAAQIKDFLSDWRVAGALMERCANKKHEFFIENDCVIIHYDWDDNGYPIVAGSDISEGDSLPRAIIEACVEALQEQDK